ncbi:uncharacterized protein BJ212DRAFT_1483612 [Suillus subaureus]|uniref:Uncharacterized protein n=1 Tax=Suillus subaureus TaxID=48587 RepID=A0A9P7E503_9AGAM|nr:uncharacterized protein BJ212DRAFT_1483612 [Suillus subaureus]KAG1811365.1 hypothetical protein BJ212DRAFT_1483612 [Suillus subaureus]
MGHKAKYFTLADKLAAQCQQQASYTRTERVKMAQQAQNTHAYAKRHAPKNKPQPLETTLLTFATLALLNSYLFHQSLTGLDLINKSDLSQWDKPPPYKYAPPPQTPDEE